MAGEGFQIKGAASALGASRTDEGTGSGIEAVQSADPVASISEHVTSGESQVTVAKAGATNTSASTFNKKRKLSSAEDDQPPRVKTAPQHSDEALGQSSKPSEPSGKGKSAITKPAADSADTTETGEIKQTQTDKDIQRYLWYRFDCSEAEFKQYATKHYFQHWNTRETRWTEPEEPYWIWDPIGQHANFDEGLQQPTRDMEKILDPETGEELERYNPKIHGNWDPTAPYAREHKLRKARETALKSGLQPGAASSDPDYGVEVTFNRATGAYQSLDKSAEMHSDYSKSTRQLNAFFDADAAANAHDGRSMKEQRRKQKLSKQEIQELTKKKKEAKLAKQRAWLLN